MLRVFQLGGSPLTPRIAVWLRDPGFRLGVFFCFRALFLCSSLRKRGPNFLELVPAYAGISGFVDRWLVTADPLPSCRWRLRFYLRYLV